jgi:hypothetical protein
MKLGFVVVVPATHYSQGVIIPCSNLQVEREDQKRQIGGENERAYLPFKKGGLLVTYKQGTKCCGGYY